MILAPLFVAVAPASPTIPPFFRLDYLEALAAEVDARIQQLYATSAQISPLRAAIMAAYMFADEAKQQQGKRGPKQVPSSS